MISDKDLRDAARVYEKAILASLPDLDECAATFSPAFEHKMKKLIFRVDHPVLYWLKWILLVLLLAGLIAAGALSIFKQPFTDLESPEPPEPAAPFASPAENDPSAFSIATSPTDGKKTVAYRPTWLPEGYELYREALYGTEGMIVYRTSDGTEAVFMYATDSSTWPDTGLGTGKEVLVKGEPAILILEQNKGELNDLFWNDRETGASFWLSAPFQEEDMIKTAESVEAQEIE